MKSSSESSIIYKRKIHAWLAGCTKTGRGPRCVHSTLRIGPTSQLLLFLSLTVPLKAVTTYLSLVLI